MCKAWADFRNEDSRELVSAGQGKNGVEYLKLEALKGRHGREHSSCGVYRIFCESKYIYQDQTEPNPGQTL